MRHEHERQLRDDLREQHTGARGPDRRPRPTENARRAAIGHLFPQSHHRGLLSAGHDGLRVADDLRRPARPERLPDVALRAAPHRTGGISLDRHAAGGSRPVRARGVALHRAGQAAGHRAVRDAARRRERDNRK